MDTNAILKGVLVKRIQDLTAATEQSSANHNALVGRLLEAKDAFANFEKALENAVKTIEDAVAKGSIPDPSAPAAAPATEVPTGDSNAVGEAQAAAAH